MLRIRQPRRSHRRAAGPTTSVLACLTLLASGLPFPVVFDFFEAEDSAARIALIDDNRTQFAFAFGLLGLGAAIAGVGLWMLGRTITPIEARRSRRRGIAAKVASWFGLVSAIGGASRLLHGVFATPEYGEDNLIDP